MLYAIYMCYISFMRYLYECNNSADVSKLKPIAVARGKKKKSVAKESDAAPNSAIARLFGFLKRIDN